MQLHVFEGQKHDIDKLSQKKWDELTDTERYAIEDFHQMREAAYYEQSCESCDLFVRGFFGTYEEPPEPAYCWHPLVDQVVNINPNFPFKNGCKHKLRGVIRKPSYWLKYAKPGVKCSYKACTDDAAYYQVSPNQGINVCDRHRSVSVDRLDTITVDQLPNLKLFCTECGTHETNWERLSKYRFKCPNPDCDYTIMYETGEEKFDGMSLTTILNNIYKGKPLICKCRNPMRYERNTAMQSSIHVCDCGIRYELCSSGTRGKWIDIRPFCDKHNHYLDETNDECPMCIGEQESLAAESEWEAEQQAKEEDELREAQAEEEAQQHYNEGGEHQ